MSFPTSHPRNAKPVSPEVGLGRSKHWGHTGNHGEDDRGLGHLSRLVLWPSKLSQNVVHIMGVSTTSLYLFYP